VIDRRGALALPALLLARPAAAISLPAAGLKQGGFVTARTTPGSRLTVDGRALRVGPRGEFCFGFGRDHGPEAVLRHTTQGGVTTTRRLAIARRAWSIQRLEGLPGAMVTPPPETMERIIRERATLAALRTADSATPYVAEGFHWPATGSISGVYGSQRILNGEPRAPHLGLDVAVPVGTPLRAAAAGQVVLAEELYFTGLTTILDHGHGVQTLYAHMSRLDTAPGMLLAAGAPLGLSGATGRVTGPHLHFGLTWFTTWLDPQPLLPHQTG